MIGGPAARRGPGRPPVIWEVAPPAPPTLLRALDVGSPLVAQLLWNRGIRDAAAAGRFLRPEREPLGDPWRMAGVGEAVRRIRAAVAAGRTIAIHGDYDVDGVTATAVLALTLQRLGADPIVHIPHRARDGYGLSPAAMHVLRDRGASLVLTVDCGITANAEVALAAELGMEVVVTDHHHVPVTLPAAAAVLNPRQPGCRYGYADLAGVGVAYVLARALLHDALPAAQAQAAADELLDLVALGTLADMVPLVGENRTLLARGLQALRGGRRPGVRALARVAGVDLAHLTAQQAAFALTPRLNAAGRMDEATAAYALLVAPDEATAVPLAERLQQLNRERQRTVEDGVALARQHAAVDAPAIVVAGEFAPGIAGLVASRLTEETGRPCVVLERGEAYCRGSARGPEGFHLAATLGECANLLVKFGGHAQAAGLTLRAEHLPAFVERFHALSAAALGPAPPPARRQVDGVLGLRAVNWEFGEALQALEPYGTGNPVPLFLTSRAVVRERRPLGESGLALRLSDGGLPLRAVLFRAGDQPLESGAIVSVVYQIERSVYQGAVRFELRVVDLRPAAG
ncbi:MAG TPA: single-stranded-DNA-specific exonuclease RecJ [Chloroflexota bacterium]|nr:single-stranded-DNA-specific exonuclease RecJ [Chloroflexota bacterium]